MNTARSLNRTLLPALLACLLCGGCTTLQPVNVAQESERIVLDKGDTVVVTTISGETHALKLVDITDDGIHGKELSIPYSDIRLLEIRRVDTMKTLLLTLGIIGAGALAADSGDGSGGGY